MTDKEKDDDRGKLEAKSTPGIPNPGALKGAECSSHRHSVSAVRHLMGSKCFTSWIFCNWIGT